MTLDPTLDARKLIDDLRAAPASRRWMVLLKSWHRFTAVVSGLRHLRRVDLTVPDTEAGREIASALRRRTYLGVRGTVAAGLLELPLESPSSYLVGRSRQALRTNCSRARRTGVACREPEWSELSEIIQAVLQARSDDQRYAAWLLGRVGDRRGRFWAAEDADGNPLAVAVVTVAGSVAHLAWMISAATDTRSDVRYLLSASVLTQLAGEGVQWVTTESVLAMPTGLVYFQQRLGFSPAHLRIRVRSNGK